MVKILYFGWICGGIVWMEFGESLGIHALSPSWLYQPVIFTKSLFIMGQYLQFYRLVPHFHDFLSSAHVTLTVQSVRSVGFGMLIEQILCGANFMLIGPQENASFMYTFILLISSCPHLRNRGQLRIFNIDIDFEDVQSNRYISKFQCYRPSLTRRYN